VVVVLSCTQREKPSAAQSETTHTCDGERQSTTELPSHEEVNAAQRVPPGGGTQPRIESQAWPVLAQSMRCSEPRSHVTATAPSHRVPSVGHLAVCRQAALQLPSVQV
jgi:hypothetical protein